MEITNELINKLVEENKRYKEALNKIAFERNEINYANLSHMVMDFKDIAEEALKGV